MILIPGFKHKEEFKVMIAIDASGSINDKELQKFLSEIKWIFKKGGAVVDYVTFDTRINEKKRLRKLTDVEAIKTVGGRGGTSFKDVLEHAEKQGAKELIIFTDGYGDQDSCKKPPNWMRVWWACTSGDMKFPFGKTVDIKTND